MADHEVLKDGTHRLNIGYEVVHISKLYGPMIFADLKVEARIGSDADEWAGWVIYRDGVEWVRIPAQLESDFQGADDPE